MPTFSRADVGILSLVCPFLGIFQGYKDSYCTTFTKSTTILDVVFIGCLNGRSSKYKIYKNINLQEA